MFDSDQQINEWRPFDSPQRGFLNQDQEKCLRQTMSHEQDEQIAKFIQNSQNIGKKEEEKEAPLKRQSIQKYQSCEKNSQVEKPFDMEKISKFIKKQKNQMRAQKKNTNFIKFLVKSYFREVKSYVKKSEQNDQQWIQFNDNLKSIVFKNGVNNLTRSSLKVLFSSDFEELASLEKQNRSFLSEAIGSPDFLFKNIIQNAYMKDHKNRMQYLLASKVFKLRCRSKRLVIRQQTR